MFTKSIDTISNGAERIIKTNSVPIFLLSSSCLKTMHIFVC